MERVAVKSSRVKSLGWADSVLEVEFVPYTRKSDGVTLPNVHRGSPVAKAFFDRCLEPDVSIGKLINDLRFDRNVTWTPVALEVDFIDDEDAGGTV